MTLYFIAVFLICDSDCMSWRPPEFQAQRPFCLCFQFASPDYLFRPMPYCCDTLSLCHSLSLSLSLSVTLSLSLSLRHTHTDLPCDLSLASSSPISLSYGSLSLGNNWAQLTIWLPKVQTRSLSLSFSFSSFLPSSCVYHMRTMCCQRVYNASSQRPLQRERAHRLSSTSRVEALAQIFSSLLFSQLFSSHSSSFSSGREREREREGEKEREREKERI